jgi:hypothetical protein
VPPPLTISVPPLDMMVPLALPAEKTICSPPLLMVVANAVPPDSTFWTPGWAIGSKIASLVAVP